MTEADQSKEDVVEIVYDQIEQAVEPEPDGTQNAQGNIWTGANQVRREGEKNTVSYSKADVDEALDFLEAEGRIINWFGLVAPATDEHLRAIIQNEIQSQFTRKILVGKCNNLLRSKKDDENSEDDETDQPVATDGGRPQNAVEVTIDEDQVVINRG